MKFAKDRRRMAIFRARRDWRTFVEQLPIFTKYSADAVAGMAEMSAALRDVRDSFQYIAAARLFDRYRLHDSDRAQ